MEYSSIPPGGPVEQKSSVHQISKSTPKEGRSQSSAASPPAPPSEQSQEDAAVLAPETVDTILTQKDEMEQELDRFYQMVYESNQKIKAAAEKLKPLRVEPRPMPSVLGLSLNGAASKLKGSGMRVGQVVAEYSERVPEGQVITQVPAPGGASSKNAKIKLVISKGPPPEKERHSTLKKQDQVAYTPMKSKHDPDKNEASPADILTGTGEIIV
ncbi:PASTA domain-containing protein [Desulforamulus ruminis]|uniref:PASTA domain containing protein n=1 Tax=Desulforamulus ruminis (strain ATCC 23193 / DSM 2154 / NCIMB 8452 / DL) TaxID=696281 RepID=F6DUN0_DESRL|nr:PASTA domain-containing protein [Desulforamulus ruminis]AEG60168.1 PASTA domain containing protein [Desulforamulus ruminis DSM 2154]